MGRLISIGFTRVVWGFGWGDDPMASDILWKIRLPKALAAAVSGMALSVAGLQMQTLFRNPLAGPYVLGVSAGASLGVALFMLGAPLLGSIATGWTAVGVAGSAWIGAAVVFGLIAILSRRIKDIMVILILGMMFSSAVGAVVEILQYFSGEMALKSFIIWTMGSLGNTTSSQLWVVVPVVLVGMALSVVVVKPLNILLTGEDFARTAGVNISRTRNIIFLSTTLLAGTVTAFCRPSGFVGLVAPPLARMVLRPALHRVFVLRPVGVGVRSVPVAALVTTLLTLPINTVTALLGIPIVVWVVARNRF